MKVDDIFCYLLQLGYTGKSMYMSYQTESNKPKFSKDVVYRLVDKVSVVRYNFQKNILVLFIVQSIDQAIHFLYGAGPI